MKHIETKGRANGLNVNNIISQNIFEDDETGEIFINLPHPLADKLAEKMGLEPIENKDNE